MAVFNGHGARRAHVQPISYIVLIIVALVLAIGMSWSHVTRRMTGQVDTDEIG